MLHVSGDFTREVLAQRGVAERGPVVRTVQEAILGDDPLLEKRGAGSCGQQVVVEEPL